MFTPCLAGCLPKLEKLFFWDCSKFEIRTLYSQGNKFIFTRYFCHENKNMMHCRLRTSVSESAQASGLKENEVKNQLQSISEPQPKKKRQRYGNYDKIQQAEIAKWGIVYGVRPAARKFGVPESTVRGIIKNYKEAKVENENLRELPR